MFLFPGSVKVSGMLLVNLDHVLLHYFEVTIIISKISTGQVTVFAVEIEFSFCATVESE